MKEALVKVMPREFGDVKITDEMKACAEEYGVESMVEWFGDQNLYDVSGYTKLHYLARNGSVKDMKEQTEDLYQWYNSVDETHGYSILDIAIIFNQKKMINYLLETAPQILHVGMALHTSVCVYGLYGSVSTMTQTIVQNMYKHTCYGKTELSNRLLSVQSDNEKFWTTAGLKLLPKEMNTHGTLPTDCITVIFSFLPTTYEHDVSITGDFEG